MCKQFFFGVPWSLSYEGLVGNPMGFSCSIWYINKRLSIKHLIFKNMVVNLELVHLNYIHYAIFLINPFSVVVEDV